MKTLALIPAALCAFGAANAQTINTTFIQSNPSELVNGTFSGAGSESVKISGVLNFSNLDFRAFCAEPLQTINPNQNVDYSIASLSLLNNATSVAKVITAFNASSQTSVDAAGAQWAIWELVGETSSTFDINSGAISIVSADATDTLVRDRAADYLANFNNFSASSITFLTNSTIQDMVTWDAVPEPSSAMLALLGGLGLVARRRR